MREPPTSRFDSEAALLDLTEASQQLLNEDHAATAGHRQIALYKSANTTIGLFAFEAGGGMREHAAPGVVSIHVLTGSLSLDVEGAVQEVGAGQVLVLGPGMKHDVKALERSTMLLTVSLGDGAS